MHQWDTTTRPEHPVDGRGTVGRRVVRALGTVAAIALLLTAALTGGTPGSTPEASAVVAPTSVRADAGDGATALERAGSIKAAKAKKAKKAKAGKHHKKKHHTKHKHKKHHKKKHHKKKAKKALPRDAANAANTGVPAGTKLTVHRGDLNITKAGTVLSGLDVRGAIKVNAPNVTIKNSIIRFRAGGYVDGIHSYSTGLKILDTEIAPTTPSPNYNGIMGSGFTATRVDVHGVVDSVHVYGNDVVVQDSWLHGNTHFQKDPNWGGKPSHDDSIQIVSGAHIKILGNTYEGAYNSGIQITQDSGRVSNVTIAGNVAGGGGCSVNVSQKGGGPIAGISVTGNRFRSDQRVNGCAIIRPRTTVVAASGNTWLANGAAVVLKNGA